jgi:hypothetical protein
MRSSIIVTGGYMISRFIGSIFLSVCCFCSLAVSSHAITRVSAYSDGDVGSFTEFTGGLAASQESEFFVYMCGTGSNGTNSFLEFTPAEWTPLSEGSCGGSRRCIQGVYAGVRPTPDVFNATCRWTETTTTVGVSAFLYTGYDPEDPVIDVACASGSGLPIVAPSIETEADSAVIRILTQNTPGFNGINNAPFEILDTAILSVTASGTEYTVNGAATYYFDEAGPTGTYDFAIFAPWTTEEGDWRACTIALRSRSFGPTPIPTMSEWGMGVFVALTAAASIWAIRWRTRTA